MYTDATTTAIFSATGLSSSSILGFLQNLFSQGYSFLVYTFGSLWPFWLVLGLVGLIVGTAFSMMHLRR